MHTKRILMVVPRFWPSIGGVEFHVDNIAKVLIKKGIQVTVVTCKHEQHLKSSEIYKNVQIIRMPFGWDRIPLLSFLWMVRMRKQLYNHEIIHVHDTVPLLTWYLPLIILNHTQHVSVTFHGFEHDPIPILFKLLRKIAKRIAHRTLCIGKFIEDIYDIKCDENIVGAVDQFSVINDQREGLVYVGRLEKDTGIEEYLKALYLLEKTHGIRMNLVICGAGKLEDSLKEYASSVNLDVQFIGIVEDPKPILASKIMCFAGGYLSILESLSVKTPVIAIAQTALKSAYYKSIKEAGGPISIQRNPARLAAEIKKLISDRSLWEQVAAKGMSLAARMSWDNMIRAYIRMWTSSDSGK